jgi:amidohydrolase
MDKKPDLPDVKLQAVKEAETLECRLRTLSMKIYQNPEPGLEEKLASEWLCTELRSEGFNTVKGVAGLETAFVGEYTGNPEAPQIGFIAEYDALPEIGHGCGHNLIGPASVGAAIVLKRILPDNWLNIKVFGTPAEENTGGKIPMLNAGLFKQTDAVMMFHAHNEDIAACPMISRVFLVMEFFGRPAHASAFPWNGVNALDAVILAFNNINALRQQMKEDARVHGIITDGGRAANIIPDYTRAEFFVRARSVSYLNEMLDKVKKCAEAAAMASGCTVKISCPQPIYLTDKKAESMELKVEENMRYLGLHPEKAVPPLGYGSSDFGNVSREVPAVLSYLKIAPKGVSTHSRDFAKAAATEEAFQALVNAVKIMSLTACDVLLEPGLLQKIRSDFLNNKEEYK